MTTVGRIGLNQLRSRATRREMPLDHVSESSDPLAHPDPEIDVLLAETVGSALQVVVDTLTPAERVAFVLHDAFRFPLRRDRPGAESFVEAARQLASRGRGRIRHTDPSDLDSAIPAAEQIVVDAFLSAAKGGDLNALVDVLDPQIVERIAVAGQPVIEVRGAESVASRAREFVELHRRTPCNHQRPAGLDRVPRFSGLQRRALAITDGRIDRMDVILDPARLRQFHIRTPATGSHEEVDLVARVPHGLQADADRRFGQIRFPHRILWTHGEVQPLEWPVIRQLRSGDKLGRGPAVESPRTKALESRLVSADRVAQSVCPFCAVGCGQKVYVGTSVSSPSRVTRIRRFHGADCVRRAHRASSWSTVPCGRPRFAIAHRMPPTGRIRPRPRDRHDRGSIHPRAASTGRDTDEHGRPLRHTLESPRWAAPRWITKRTI